MTQAQRVAGRPLAARVLAWLLFVLAVGLGAASVPLAGAARQLTADNILHGAMEALLVVVLAGVGLVVAQHLPRNPLGWLFLGAAVFFEANSVASSVEVADYRLHGHLPLGPAAVVLQPSWAPAIALFGLAFLLFPDGKPLSPRLRWVVRCYLAAAAAWVGGAFAITTGAVVSGHFQVTEGGDLAVIDHPAGAAVVWGVAQDLFFTALALSWTAVVIQMLLSYRRSVGERRQQLKWLASGAAACLAGGAVTLATSGASGVAGVISDISVAVLAALPVSMGVAILRFRLYDIDRVISRTLAYTIVTGLLVGVYTGLVLLTGGVLRFHTPVAVAAATLAAAALFNPVRRRVQHAVDRRFNRTRYDADQTLTASRHG